MNMKKSICLVMLAALLSGGAFVAEAQGNNKGGFSGPKAAGGGFSGPGPEVVSIMDASKKADDTWVTLRGNIIEHNGDDKYTFRDASGQGTVEIDHDKWGGVQVGPTDTVELITKVDKDWGMTELEVKQVRKVQ